LPPFVQEQFIVLASNLQNAKRGQIADWLPTPFFKKFYPSLDTALSLQLKHNHNTISLYEVLIA
jgi:hypothetical protein